jgi:hypothetical protein
VASRAAQRQLICRNAVAWQRIRWVEAKIVVDCQLESLGRFDSGMELFRVTRLDEQVAVRKIEAREDHRSGFPVLPSDHHRVIQRGHQFDIGVVEVSRHHLIGLPEFLTNSIATILRQRIRRREPERDDRRIGNLRDVLSPGRSALALWPSRVPAWRNRTARPEAKAYQYKGGRSKCRCHSSR